MACRNRNAGYLPSLGLGKHVLQRLDNSHPQHRSANQFAVAIIVSQNSINAIVSSAIVLRPRAADGYAWMVTTSRS